VDNGDVQAGGEDTAAGEYQTIPLKRKRTVEA